MDHQHNRSNRWGVGWLVVGVTSLIFAAAIFVAPGFSIRAQTPVGETVTIEVEPGDTAVYYRGDVRWGDLDCTILGEHAGENLNPDMTQRDVRVPRHWKARGTFSVTAPTTVELTCASLSGQGGSAEFAVGPWVTFQHSVASVFFGLLGLVGVLIGVVMLRRTLSRGRGRRAGRWSAGPTRPPARP